jgi:GNAT superfamily N-acetyltransferase
VSRGSSEVHLDAPVEVAWDAVVSPERREWYFRLKPEGSFEEGRTIRWLDVREEPAEETEIVEMVAPSRLTTQTRFLFAEVYKRQPAHTVTWEVSPDGMGSRVRLSWDAGEVVGGLLASEAENILAGLRLQHDPTIQAELARLPRIGEIEIRDVTPDRVGHYQEFFDKYAFRDYPAWRSCYCMETHRTQGDEAWAMRTADDNRRDMSEMISNRNVTALLAFVDGKPVGWCNYGETTKLAGVMHRFQLKGETYEGVGSVACFVISAPYRRHGVAKRLLDTALDRLRERGVKVVEAYPVKETESPQSNYRGPLSMYLQAGFESHRETGPFQIVRKTL